VKASNKLSIQLKCLKYSNQLTSKGIFGIKRCEELIKSILGVFFLEINAFLFMAWLISIGCALRPRKNNLFGLPGCPSKVRLITEEVKTSGIFQ